MNATTLFHVLLTIGAAGLALIIFLRCFNVLLGMNMRARKCPYWYFLLFGLSYVAVAAAAVGAAIWIGQGEGRGNLSIWGFLIGSAGMILFDRRRREKVGVETATWMGRDVTHGRDIKPEIIQNAQYTVDKVNELLAVFKADTGIIINQVASGWRPPSINGTTPNAAKGSKHLVGLAVDLRDTPARDLARWCLAHTGPYCYAHGLPDVLEQLGLWMEDPQWTWDQKKPGMPWVHLQSVPPGSGKHVYRPSEADPLAAKLPEQGGVA